MESKTDKFMKLEVFLNSFELETGISREEIARYCVERIEPKSTISNPSDASSIFIQKIGDSEVEILSVLLLDDDHNILCEPLNVFKGTQDTAECKPSIIFKEILKIKNATTFMLCHNHPTGDLDPSEDDLKITKTMVYLSDLLELTMLDHLIVSSTNFKSLRQDHPEIWND